MISMQLLYASAATENFVLARGVQTNNVKKFTWMVAASLALKVPNVFHFCLIKYMFAVL